MARDVGIQQTEILDLTVGPDDFRPPRDEGDVRRFSGGTGSPENRIVGDPGDVFVSDVGLFQKMAGRGTVGWVPVGVGSAGAEPSLLSVDTAPVSAQTFVAANDADFSWVHQGDAVVEVDDDVFLHVPGTMDRYLAVRTKPVPQAPYLVRVGMQVASLAEGKQFGGVCWRNSETGQLLTAGILAGSLAVEAWADPETFLQPEVIYPSPFTSMAWIELADDGDERRLSYSIDGKRFMGFHHAGDQFDEIGYCAQANSVCDVGVTLLSWEEK